MTKWNLKNASEKEKEIYRQEFEKVYQKELQRRTPVVPASKSVSVDTPKTAAQKQNRAAVKSGGPVLMPMAQKERQREAQQRTAQQFQQFGMDPTAIVGQQAGQIVGNWLKDKAAETGIDPGKSKAAYIAEKGLGGAATSVEGAYNNILDNARAQVNAQLTNGYVTDTGVNLRDMQNFWAAVFGGKHAQYAQDTQAADKAVAEQLPAAADRLRSTKAAEYAQGLDEKYGATGLWKVGGDLAAGVGGMLPSIGVNAVTGGTLGLPYIMSSAAGNAAAQARAYGADEDTALVYGLLSGATEGATEKIVGGIPGLGGGWMDKAIQRVAGSSAGRRAVKRLADVFGEGLEEALSELIGSQLEKMYLNREDWRSGGEILQDTAYSMLLGALTSAAMNAPGDIRTRRTGAKINALGGANDVISEGLRAPADGDVDGNADRLSLAAELARRATDGAKLSNADLGELYQMNARTGQQLFTLPMLEQRADQRAAEAEAAQDAKKDAASAIKTDSVTGEPASIGDAATSLNTIIPQKQGDSNPLPVIWMPMAQQAMPASKAEAKATNAQLLEKLRGSIPEIQGMQPVAEITGKEFAKNAEKNLVQQVGDYFRTLGNKVFRRGLGEVVLDERGVKDSMAHGIGRRKAAAFAAVPQVIAQGRQIDTQQNWKGRGYDTLVFAAPVKVGADTNYIAAVVTKSTENNRYYLHEVVDQNGNIIYQKKDAANAIKTDSVTGEPASIGGATTSFDNIVPQSGENATDGGRFLPPMGGDAAQSGARQNAEADTPGVILPPMKGMPDMAAATGDGLQLNANAENPGTAAGNEKSKRIQNRRENAFVDRVGDALSVPKGARREYLKPLADAMAAEIKQNGRVSEATASEVFNAAYDRGIMVMDEYYNQYKELKDELRGNALTLDSESRSSREYKDMAYIDDFTSNVVTRAKYYDNIKAGMDASSAMQEADRYAASLMADRSKGALPTVFERKNPLTRLLTMYQVEVNNQLRHLFKDLPDDLKEKGMAALVAGLMKYTIGAYLFNDLYEKLVGRRPALDFLGIANEAVGDYTGYQLPNTVDAAQQLISGEGVDFTTQRKGAVQATASLAENVAQELPFVGGVLGGGRVPISSALPDMGNLVSNAVGLASGEKDAGRALQGIGKELAKPAFYILPPLGGGQLKKAFEGITTVANGGQFGYDSQGRETMKFPVENPTLGTYAQAALFGPYSLPMAQDYVDSGFRAKSAKYTEAYRAATGAGVEGEKFRAMMDAMDADGNGTLSAGEVTQGLEGHGLTPEQKAAVWQVYASDEAKAKYKAAQAVGAGEQYILMLPMLDADKNGSVSTDELYAAMDSQGLDAGQQAALWYAYAGSGQRMKYEKAEEYGLGRIYAEMLRYADTNNSGTLNKDELRAYLDSTGLNRAQKAVLFELASTAKNPYE